MIIKKRKYPDIPSLASAFQSGELSREDYMLMVDNDESFLVFVGEAPEGYDVRAARDYREMRTDEAREWFQGAGYSDLVDACNAAGIPAEWV